MKRVKTAGPEYVLKTYHKELKISCTHKATAKGLACEPFHLCLQGWVRGVRCRSVTGAPGSQEIAARGRPGSSGISESTVMPSVGGSAITGFSPSGMSASGIIGVFGFQIVGSSPVGGVRGRLRSFPTASSPIMHVAADRPRPVAFVGPIMLSTHYAGSKARTETCGS